MSLKVSEVLNDSLVQETIKSLEGQRYVSAPSQESLDEHPVLKLLEKTGGLDSLTAAALVADEMVRGSDMSVIGPLLPKEVGDTARLLNATYGQEVGETMSSLLASGNPVAAKLAVSALVISASGEEFEEAKRQMPASEMRKMANEFLPVFVETIDALVEKKSWQDLPAGLLAGLVEATSNIGEFVTGNTHKKLLAASLETLRGELAAAGIDTTVSVIVPPPVIRATALSIDEVLNDPLVREAVAATGTGNTPDLEGNPLIKFLAETKSLDSVTAAALVLEDMRHGHTVHEASVPKEVREVLTVLTSDAAMYGDPTEMFNSDNHSIQKIGIATIAYGLTSDEFKEAKNSMPAEQLREMTSQMLDSGISLIDRVIETKAWQGMSPELIGKFDEGMQELSGIVQGATRKKLIASALQSLKEEIASGTAAEITTPVVSAPVSPGLTLDTMLADPLVQETMKALKGHDPYMYPLTRRDLDEVYPLQVLADHGALDPLTAAVMVADEMMHGDDAAQSALPKQVAVIVAKMFDANESFDENKAIDNMLLKGDPVLTKIMAATFIFAANEMGNVRHEMSADEAQETYREMAASFIGLAGNLSAETGRNAVPGSMLDSILGVMEKLGREVDDKAVKQDLSNAANGLRQATGRVVAAEQDNAPVAVAKPAAKRKAGGLNP